MIPQGFADRMHALLGAEFSDYVASLSAPRAKGVRLNAPKPARLPWPAAPVPWAEEGRILPEGVFPGRHALHACGAFYVQDPSAMAPVAALDPKPDERVLDLCAAPGGKATQAAIRMRGGGIVVANEIDRTRVGALTENVARLGLGNVLVTNASPAALCERFAGAFDAVIVDAPCSGEGLFRKDDDAWRFWNEESVRACAMRQAAILDSAAQAVCAGGRLVYSTCTFSVEENEAAVAAFLARHTDFSLVPTGLVGASAGLALPHAPETELCARFWPQRGQGEGQFVALLRKDGERRQHAPWSKRRFPTPSRAAAAAWSAFADAVGADTALLPPTLVAFGDTLYALGQNFPPLEGLPVPTGGAGLLLGSVKKDRFEPAWALAVFAGMRARSIEVGADTLGAYLAGETFASDERGWRLVTHRGLAYGWCKCSDGIAKNAFPKALRRRYDL